MGESWTWEREGNEKDRGESGIRKREGIEWKMGGGKEIGDEKRERERDASMFVLRVCLLGKLYHTPMYD